MGGAHSRAKGAQGERDVVNLAKAVGFDEAMREAPLQAGHGDRFSDVAGVEGLSIEVKRYRRVPVNQLVKTTLGPRTDKLVPVLVWRDDGARRWCATLDAEVALRLYHELLGLRALVRGRTFS